VKTIICAVLCLFAFGAHAQQASPPPQPACWPALTDSNSWTLPGSALDRAAWTCKGKYANTYHWMVGSWSEVLSCTVFAPAKLLNATSAEKQEMWQRCVSSPTDAQRATAEPMLIELRAKNPPPRWKVKPATKTTRPMYPVVNGVRGTTASGLRATVGTDCACNVLAIEEGAVSYCPLKASTVLLTQVTVCAL
jgi:hypothetical protein